ncbi:MAG: tetratricopeptide repeat protein [Gammaproteobacteria bacterium]|nr:tetratricopeptide repeat protein [Gammaproteobacteria bacterium]
MTQHTRQSVAIMFTDLCGYSAWVQRDETRALEMLKRHWALLRPVFAGFEGREIKTIGDAFLIEFPSTLQAVRAGLAMQAALQDHNQTQEPAWHIRVRIGIHTGDVERLGEDVFGDGVNIASRIEHLAPPGGICITESVYAAVQNKIEEPFHSLGTQHLKNISQPVVVYCNRPDEGRKPARKPAPLAVAAAVLAGVVLLGAVMVQVWRNRAPEASDVTSPKVLAVLPFENLGGDENNAAFTAGIHDTLITRIAKIGGMTVISRTSVMAYEGARPNLKDVAKALGVTHVVEGSVQRSGEQVRIQAQLIDAATDTHLWAETFDRTLSQGFAMQSEIATAIARELSVRLTDQERAALSRAPTENAKAFEQYVLGHAALVSFALDKGLRHLEAAIELDPNFALAIAELSMAHTGHAGFRHFSSAEHVDAARKTYEHVLALWPDLPEGILARGVYHYFAVRDFPAAEPDLTAAVALLPNNHLAHEWLGHMRRRQGRWTEAAALLERAASIEPAEVNVLYSLNNVYTALRQRAPLERAVLRTRTANPDAAWPAMVDAFILLRFDGDLGGNVAALEADYVQHPEDDYVVHSLGRGYLSQGRFQDAATLYESYSGEILGIGGSRETMIGLAYLEAGDHANAARWLEMSLSRLNSEFSKPAIGNSAGFLRIYRALSLAGLGRKDDALSSVREMLAMFPRKSDEIIWAFNAYEAAALQAQLGDIPGAMDLVRQLLDPPTVYMPYQIWFHWNGASLRASPEFRELMARHGVDVTRDPRATTVPQQATAIQSE